MNRSIPSQQPWVALGSPATQEFYALVRNYGVKRMVRLKVESLYIVLYSSLNSRIWYAYQLKKLPGIPPCFVR